MASRNTFESANERGRRLQASVPKAVSARYDRRKRRIVIGLSSNEEVDFSPRDAQGLEKATPSQLEEIEISPSGLGIHFPRLDADLYLPAIRKGLRGSRKWMASRSGGHRDRLGEMLPEYDFSRGRPNKYAVRYTPRLVSPLLADERSHAIRLELNTSFMGVPFDFEAPFTLGFSSDNARGVHHGEL